MGRRSKTTTIVQGPTQAELDQRERQHQEQMTALQAQEQQQLAYQAEQNRIAQQQAETQRQSLLRQERTNNQSARQGLISQRIAASNQSAQAGEGLDQANQIEQAQTSQQSRLESRTDKSRAEQTTNRRGVISSLLRQRTSRGLI